MHEGRHVIVLGAGIQGICTALALRYRGLRVTLVEREAHVMTQASLRNEGKVHMGFVYVKDASGRTPELMLEAAMKFAPLLERWLGGALPWNEVRSHPFVYCHLAESMLERDALLDSYERLQAAYRSMVSGGQPLHYLGERPERLWHFPGDGKLSLAESLRQVRECIPTVEIALELSRFRGWLERAIDADDGIELLVGHGVEGIARTAHGLKVSGARADGSGWSVEGDIVVNCLWSNRLALDRAFVGTTPTRKWVYRLKYRLLGRLPAALDWLPSMTFVVGPFGDIVTHPKAETYFSWYPSCLQGWSQELSPPSAWESACAGRPDSGLVHEITERSLAALARIVPGIEDSVIATTDAGVIFSWGDTDIDDSESELHVRYDIGVSGEDGYYSIDTGKFTCAPLFAERLAELVT